MFKILSRKYFKTNTVCIHIYTQDKSVTEKSLTKRATLQKYKIAYQARQPLWCLFGRARASE